MSDVTSTPPERNGAASAPPRDRAKSSRRRAREYALQGLYEWQLGRAEAKVVHAHIREQDEYNLCDSAHFDALLSGCFVVSTGSDFLSAEFPHGQGVALMDVPHRQAFDTEPMLYITEDAPFRHQEMSGVPVGRKCIQPTGQPGVFVGEQRDQPRTRCRKHTQALQELPLCSGILLKRLTLFQQPGLA